jgi:hypothetical protein
MKAQQGRKLLIAPSVGIQAAKEHISSHLVNIVGLVPVRVAQERQRVLSVIAPPVIRCIFTVLLSFFFSCIMD